MLLQVLSLGLLVGVIHFVVVGLLYGNPVIDGIYARAQAAEPGVKRWASKPRYLISQFLGTQIEVFILTLGFLWLRPILPIAGWQGSLVLGLLFAALRVYPRFWNMWIQSTYPSRLLKIELVNGTISTLVIVGGLQILTGGLS